MSLIGWDELLPDLPRPGWAGRNRAIVRGLFRAVIEAVLFILILAAFSGVLIVIAGATDGLPR